MLKLSVLVPGTCRTTRKGVEWQNSGSKDCNGNSTSKNAKMYILNNANVMSLVLIDTVKHVV